jgi:hypothetical protein
VVNTGASGGAGVSVFCSLNQSRMWVGWLSVLQSLQDAQFSDNHIALLRTDGAMSSKPLLMHHLPNDPPGAFGQGAFSLLHQVRIHLHSFLNVWQLSTLVSAQSHQQLAYI